MLLLPVKDIARKTKLHSCFASGWFDTAVCSHHERDDGVRTTLCLLLCLTTQQVERLNSQELSKFQPTDNRNVPFWGTHVWADGSGEQLCGLAAETLDDVADTDPAQANQVSVWSRETYQKTQVPPNRVLNLIQLLVGESTQRMCLLFAARL